MDVKVLTPDKPYTADELSTMWPKLRPELLAHAQILERDPTVENAQVRVGIKAAVQMGDGYIQALEVGMRIEANDRDGFRKCRTCGRDLVFSACYSCLRNAGAV